MRILFLHGFSAGGAVWDQYRSEFPAAGMPTIPFSAEGVPALPELAGPAILVGWSMGGMIAVEMLRHQPQFVKGLVLVSSSPSYVASDLFPEGKPLSALRELRVAVEKGDLRTLQDFQRTLFTAAEIRGGWLNRFRREIGPALRADRETLLAQLAFLERYRAPRELPQVPVAVLHGTGDAVVAPSAAAAWQQLFPEAAVTTLDAGHAIPFVHRRAVGSALNDMRGAHGA